MRTAGTMSLTSGMPIRDYLVIGADGIDGVMTAHRGREADQGAGGGEAILRDLRGGMPT